MDHDDYPVFEPAEHPVEFEPKVPADGPQDILEDDDADD